MSKQNPVEAGKAWKEKIIKAGWKPSSIGWYPEEELKLAGMVWSKYTEQYEISDVVKFVGWQKSYRPSKIEEKLSIDPIENLLLKIKEKENE